MIERLNNMRTRTTALTLVSALFLLAQIAIGVHDSAYGDQSHSHDGLPCSIASTHQNLDVLDTSAVFEIITPENHFSGYQVTDTENVITAAIQLASARAPPFAL